MVLAAMPQQINSEGVAPTDRGFIARRSALPITILTFGGILTLTWISLLGYLLVELLLRVF